MYISCNFIYFWSKTGVGHLLSVKGQKIKLNLVCKAQIKYTL